MKYKDSGDRDFDLEARESQIRAEADAIVLKELIELAAYKLGFRPTYMQFRCGDNEITLGETKFIRTHASSQEVEAARELARTIYQHGQEMQAAKKG